MKTIRNLMTFAGFFVVFLALVAPAAKGQVLDKPSFAGQFTLPFEAQWGSMTLPAGDYTLSYGLLGAGQGIVEVQGKAKGSPHGMIRVEANGPSSATKSGLVCVREGNVLVVRALELPDSSTIARFAMPRGTQLTAHQRNGSKNAQLAEAHMLIQRIPVTLNAK